MPGATLNNPEVQGRSSNVLGRPPPFHTDDEGQVKRWYVVSTDIDERKRAEERLQKENISLHEEIDKASMFEEIVGTSKPLKAVLSRIAKVAPTDSTVLITGETGARGGGMVMARMGVWGKGQQSLAPPQHVVTRSASSAPNRGALNMN